MSKFKFLVLVLLSIIVNISCKQKEIALMSSKLTFGSLACDSKHNPTAIENVNPLFSWIVKAEGFNKSQSAYHVLVASSKEKLNENDADVWNSGKVESDKSAFVKYSGKVITSDANLFLES